MTTDTVVQAIQQILAPAVLTTVCAILLGDLQTRYAAINDRMRALARERLDLLQSMSSADAPPLITERLDEIAVQAPDLLHRHTLMRDAVLAVYIAVVLFVVSMLCIAGATVAAWVWLATTALVVFLVAAAILLGGVIVTAIEVYASHRAVHYELRRVLGLLVRCTPS